MKSIREYTGSCEGVIKDTYNVKHCLMRIHVYKHAGYKDRPTKLLVTNNFYIV